MRRRTVLCVAAIALAAAGAANAISVGGRVIHVQAGDRIVVNKSLGCLVEPSEIVCGGASRSKVSADVRSSGEIVIQIQPDPHGAYPGLFVDGAKCNSSGVCHLVLRNP